MASKKFMHDMIIAMKAGAPKDKAYQVAKDEATSRRNWAIKNKNSKK
ncbi:hypothetical protein [Methanolapillus millepedarum]|uniref:Uncharacterized protein n=1 Tax=Methanolapillus millepedarum TaxID=3028296 RepID=A0AA96V520_9EURY|nr:hypothetical protein MsAc7_06850 [Methanosarcinaceae archaeon Ac7]